MRLLVCILLVGCGQAGEIATNSYRCTMEGELCHEAVTNSRETEAEEGTDDDSGWQGDPGIPGRDGRDGTDGSRGPAGDTGERGQEGPGGSPGEPGTQGEPGIGCFAERVAEGAQITCGDEVTIVYDGEPGVDAPPIEVIDPCGTQGANDEILIYTGEYLLRIVKRGSNWYLGTRLPGNYTTIDGTGCNYTVNTDLTVSW